jgi:hypothetical protein
MAANGDVGSTVQLGSATYVLSQGSLQPVVNMTIVGAGPSATKISQTANDRVIFASAVGTTVNLTGLTITGGNVTGGAGASGLPGGDVYGGGILNYGAMTLTNDVLTGNTATGGSGGSNAAGGGAFGGAIASGDPLGDLSALTLVDTTVSRNVGQGGIGGEAISGAAGSGGSAAGAVWANKNATLVLRDSIVSDDELSGGAGGPAGSSSTSAGLGGSANGAVVALFVGSGGTAAIIDSTIADNTATGGTGGAVLFTIAPGPAGGGVQGGGVTTIRTSSKSSGRLTMTGSTISGNTVTGGRGGFSNNDAGGAGGSADGGGMESDIPSTIVNSTITGNSAAGGLGGTGGTTDGTLGTGIGGGVELLGFADTLASVTLTNNSATGLIPGSDGGNLYNNAAAGHMAFADTIVAAGSASDSGSNCELVSAPADNGHNLENTSPSQCGFSTANGDLIGANPGLFALASNGGPTQTRALGRGSQALGAGDSCIDPSQPGSPPLTLDQRGLPRPAGGCDIGAFQFQPPAETIAPQISGTPTVGDVLTCSKGSWTGDQLTFGLKWLRNGIPIPGATESTYTVASADLGHQLVCRVTASNLKATVSKDSASLDVPFPDQAVTVSKAGDGSGTVTSSPAGISCGSACTRAYTFGSAVTLTAQAGQGSMFTAWSGACTGKATCVLAMTAPRAVTATFLKDCVVPKLKGKRLRRAKRAIKAHDCTIGKIKHATSTKVKKGHVISQKPKPGKQLAHGAKVRLVVSKGK